MAKLFSVNPQDDYTLILVFDGGMQRLFDARPYLDKGIFTEPKDLSYFKRAVVAFGTVQWPHEQDFAPETLHLESKELAKSEF